MTYKEKMRGPVLFSFERWRIPWGSYCFLQAKQEVIKAKQTKTDPEFSKEDNEWKIMLKKHSGKKLKWEILTWYKEKTFTVWEVELRKHLLSDIPEDTKNKTGHDSE